MITHDRAIKILDYNPETGVLSWKPRGNSKFDGRFAGKPAGTIKSDGYVRIMVDRQFDYAHRIAWLICTGSYPDKMIDHANGDASDNRWANLRMADHAQNAWNAGKSKINSTGYKGVYLEKRTGRYYARISYRKNRLHLGTYDTPEEAHAAYCKAAVEKHGNFSRVS